jgi:hypothetical protein
MMDNIIYGIDFQNPNALSIRRIERQLSRIRKLALQLHQDHGLFRDCAELCDTAPCEMNPDDSA